jgi:hypothetical protein
MCLFLSNSNRARVSTVSATCSFFFIVWMLIVCLFSIDMGVLRVTLVDGHDIRGVDRSGKSDPYAVFSLNGQKVFKSQTKKKTLKPVWNETFTVSVVRIYYNPKV